MGMKVKYKNGYEGSVSDKVAEILEKRGDVEIIEVLEKQHELDLSGQTAKPSRVKK
jgi:hypothetical protein